METTLSSKNRNITDKPISYTNTRKLDMEKIKEKLEEVKLENESQCNEELNQILNEIMEKLDRNGTSKHKIHTLHDKMSDRIETKKGRLPEKYFMARNSLLTDLAELPHLNTIRNFAIASWLIIVLNIVVTDLVKKGTLSLGLGEGFTNIHMAVFIWICMFTSTVAIYYAFFLWGIVRVNLIIKTNSFMLKLWDTLWLSLFVIYCFSFFYLSIRAITDNSLEIIVSTLIVTETSRLFMKTYAFVRSNAPRVLEYKLHDEDKILCPEFSKYLYFSFAPTSIYRDSYPRTTHIRWSYVACYGAEIIAMGLTVHFIQAYILVPSFDDYDLKKITPQDFILLMGKHALPNVLCWLCFVFFFVHALQNLFAELLRFADRLFYKDWWNTNSAEKFYTDFSVAVYDWSYTYIYKDMYEIVLPKNRIVAKIVEAVAVFVLHEFMYSFPYRCYSTIMLAFYFVGIRIAVKYMPKNYFLANTFYLYGHIMGITLLRTSLTLEYYVRLSCPVQNPTLLSYFIPRTFTCGWYEEN